MDINSQCLQQSSVQETERNGTRGLLYSTVQGEVATPVSLTTIFQSWLSFVTHCQKFKLKKVQTDYYLTYLGILYFFCLEGTVQINFS